MPVKSRISFFIIFFSFIFFIINEFLSYKLNFNEERNRLYESDKVIVSNLFKSQENYLSSLSELLVNDPMVVEAYEKNSPLLLKNHLMPIWNALKRNKYIYEIHFFKPPAISFVNFSNFESTGVDVGNVRNDMVWVTSSFRKSSHLFMCRSYAGYRSTQAIVGQENKVLGGISIGKKVDWLPKILKERTSHNAFLIYSQKSTQTLAPKYFQEFTKNKEKFNHYFLANKTINIATKELKNVDFDTKIQNISIGGNTYILYSYPLEDFNHKKMGYLCTTTQLTLFKESFMNASLKDTILIFLTILLLLLINRKYNQKIYKNLAHIESLTHDIKERNFKILHDNPQKNKFFEVDSLLKIKKNIINMGLSLEEYYNYLEDKNADTSKKLIEELYTDKITKMGNLNALLRDLAQYNESYLSLFNVKGFKNINDAFGFKVGDYILKAIANISTQTLPDTFLICRISNDEFAILNKTACTQEKFTAQINNILSKLENHTFKFFSIDIKIYLYAGICLQEGKKLEKASIAIRKAKENKLSYYVYKGDEDTQELEKANIKMANQIATSLASGDIVPYFQPIVNKHEEIIKYEALVRMIEGEKVISPYFFLEISKKTKLYTEITKRVILYTFETFKNSSKMFSINLTATDMINQEIVDLIYTKLDNHARPQQVVFEIVESDDIYSLKSIESFLMNVQKKGAKLAIDDFGTGYSNFSYIIKMKPDYLKIDGSLIKNIDTDVLSYKSVETIVHFAHDLNIKVVAEFIHSKEVYEICKKIGVDEFQGFYFSEAKSEIAVS